MVLPDTILRMFPSLPFARSLGLALDLSKELPG